MCAWELHDSQAACLHGPVTPPTLICLVVYPYLACAAVYATMLLRPPQFCQHTDVARERPGCVHTYALDCL